MSEAALLQESLHPVEAQIALISEVLVGWRLDNRIDDVKGIHSHLDIFEEDHIPAERAVLLAPLVELQDVPENLLVRANHLYHALGLLGHLTLQI